MITAAECVADLDELGGEKFTGEIHGDLAGGGERLGSRL